MRARLKMRNLKPVAALALIAALAACRAAAPELSNEAIVSTPQGPVQGVTTESPDIFNFKGLPYAASPVGNLRWAAPQPAPTWTETRAADSFGDRCMQIDDCLLYTSPSPRDATLSRMPSSA